MTQGKNIIALSLLISGNALANEKPNIVYVFPDQMRNHAMQFWNEKPYSRHVNFKADPVHTPNLNAFASEAVVLNSAYSNCPLSSPHRSQNGAAAQ